MDSSQNLTKTGGQELVVVLATRAGLVIFGLAIQSLLAYALLPEGRGAYAVCVMFGSLLAVLFIPGAERGTQYFVMAKKISVSQGISFATTICLVGSFLGISLSMPLIHSDISFFQKAEIRSFYLSLTLVPLSAFSSVMQFQLAGLRRFGKLFFFLLLQSLTNLIGIFSLVSTLGLGVDGAILSLAASHLVLIITCLWDLKRNCRLVFEIPRHFDLRPILNYGLRYHPARIAVVLDPRIGGLLLGMFANRAEISFFIVGYALMSQALTIPDSVSKVLLPRVASDERGRPELVAFCNRVSGWVAGAGILAFLAISNTFVPIVFSEAFLPVVPLIWIMAPGILASAGTGVFLEYFRGVNRPEICSWAMWIGMCGNVFCFFILYPELGVKGAALAMTVGRIIRSAYLSIMFHRMARLGLISTWMPQRGDVAHLLASGQSIIKRLPRKRFTKI